MFLWLKIFLNRLFGQVMLLIERKHSENVGLQTYEIGFLVQSCLCGRALLEFWLRYLQNLCWI